MGTVACALITSNNLIFKGVCIDTSSGMGFCAEHTAISQMITQREYQIQKIVALKQDNNGLTSILPACGRCRELMYQINNSNIETQIIIGENKIVQLKDILTLYNISENIN